MTQAALEFLKGLIAPGVISGLISLAIGIYFKQRADERLEQSKSLMRQVEEETKTRFSWLYEARARAMMTIYERLITVDESVQLLLSSTNLYPSQEAFDTVADRANRVWKSIRDLDRGYKPARLLF